MKRIISVLLAATIALSCSIGTFASNLEEIFESVTSRKDEADEAPANNETASEEADPFANLPTFLKPTDQLYKVFIDIMKLYAEEHLYDFTEEELMYKFFYDIIATHPEMYELMLNTLLRTMDPYSAYHPKNSGYLSLESDSAGYGITVADTKNGILIEKVLKESEAEKAGILPGDIITGIFGYDTTMLPWYAVSMLLKRPYVYISEKDEDKKYPDYNPEILLTVNRGGETLNFTLKKGVMINDELTSSYKERDGQQIAYIAVSSFVAEDLAERFKAEIERFKSDGYTKLVIDLRNNGGGSLGLATDMAELFVDNGTTMCYYNDKNTDEPIAVISDTEKVEFDSISVLVNEYTASAAELMANILKNCAGAVLVGHTTYGKAIGQSVYNLYGGASFTITTYEVLDVNKNSYNGIGLEPDLALENVEMLYKLPELGVFNHINYKEIIFGAFSDPCLALEKRLEVLGLLKNEMVDGIWDNYTSLSVYILQKTYFTNHSTAYLDDRTVTLITDLVNNCKDDTYFEDSQLDCALLYHSAFDQAKRLIKEKEKLAKKQAELIKENNEKLEAEAELAD